MLDVIILKMVNFWMKMRRKFYYINKDTKTADKCTWCYHRVRKGKLPACVNACPTGARKFGDLNDPSSEVSKIYNSKSRLKVLKKDLGNEPSLYYIDLHEEVV